MKTLNLAFLLLLLSTSFIAAQAEGLGKFHQFSYTLIPDWCDVVHVTMDDKRVSELRLGQVYTFTNSGPARFGYECRKPGYGGMAILCSKVKLVHIIFGLNIEGRKEKKISILCIE